MKYTLILFLLIPVFLKAQDNTIVTNLQLKGGTVKLIVATLQNNVASDTSIQNMFQKWKVDYIDGSIPNDNANVTISFSKTANVVLIYSLLLRQPAGMIDTNNFLNDFRTSIQSKRTTNPVLDAECTNLETKIAGEYTALLQIGLGSLLTK